MNPNRQLKLVCKIVFTRQSTISRIFLVLLFLTLAQIGVLRLFAKQFFQHANAPINLQHERLPSSQTNAQTPTKNIDFQKTPKFFEKLPISIKEYVKWHSNTLSCLHRKHCSSNSQKVLVWGCPERLMYKCGGMGDRIRGIQFSLLLSIVTKRLLLIDWPEQPFPVTDAIEPSLINWTVPLNFKYKDNVVLLHTAWPYVDVRQPNDPSKKYAYRNLSTLTLNSIDLRKEDFISALNEYDILSIWSSATLRSVTSFVETPLMHKLFQDLTPKHLSKIVIQKMLLQILFQPSISVQAKIENTLKKLPDSYISVHARTGGDFGEHINPRFSNLKNTTRLAHQLLDCVDTIYKNDSRFEARRVFLASDSISLKLTFIDIARKRNVMTVTEVIPAAHIGRKWGAPNMLRKSRTTLSTSFLNIFTEFFGIAYAEVVVGNESGFSRMAFFTGNSTEYVVAKINGSGNSGLCVRHAEIFDSNL